MKHELENKKYYQSTFDEVHASEDLLGKVKNMKKEMNHRKTVGWKRAGYGVLAAAAVLIASNSIVYAATGSTWIEKMILSINGVEEEMEMTKGVDEEGKVYYSGTKEVGEGDIEVEVTAPLDGEYGISAEINEVQDEDGEKSELNIAVSENGFQEIAGILTEEDGRIYFRYGENVKIDVTEDIQDGLCEGSFESEGEHYQYQIEGTADAYTCNILAD